MSNCSAPIAKTQKKLLKVLNSLFQQYIVCQTPSAKAFFASPSNATYGPMYSELSGLSQVINATPVLAKLNTASVNAFARIVAFDAEGLIAFDSSKDNIKNTYTNYTLTIGSGNAISGSNYGTRKGTQKLNVDECAVNVYQVKPAQSHAPAPYGTVTEAGVYERMGCPGVSNVGFLRLTIEVDITAYPFNSCDCGDNSSSSN